MVKFSNPRRHAEFNDWPSGGKRVNCVFNVESHPKRGERVSRITTGKPKYTTYHDKCAIVDGDDGKTYILTLVGYMSMVAVYRSDFMMANEAMGGLSSSVFMSSKPELYSELKALVLAAV